MVPFLKRYGTRPAFFAVDLINEAEGAIGGINFISGRGTPWAGCTWRTMQSFIKECASAAHAAVSGIKVTASSGWHAENNIKRFVGLGLDFLDWHSYRNDGKLPLTSKLSLEPLMELLNDWLERASQRLFEMGGTIDKYMGDGIMAIFGAPLPQPDHAIRSVYAEFQLQEAFEVFRQDHQLGFGVGIATGIVVVGNLGSRRRMEYTAVGDAVNLAARLEKVATDQDIIVDEATYVLLQERFAHVVLSQIKVKGKDPMDLYKLTAIKKPWK